MRRFEASLLCLSAFVSAVSAIAAQHDKAECTARPYAAPAEARAEMARYSLKAYENVDEKNPLKAMLFTPKPVGTSALPMVVYIPGNGELGDVARQFRQKAIFERVTSSAFQEKYPCYLLALSPPKTATTLLGGMPGHPTAMQTAIREFVLAVPAACGFYVSPHAEWMVDNTIPRLAWYVAAIPLFELIGSGN